MKNFIIILIIMLVPGIAGAQFPPSTVPQGGTGWGAVTSGHILFGDTTLRLATSTALHFDKDLSRLTVTHASTTALSVFGTAYFGGTATSTFNSAGLLTVQGLISTASSTFSSTLDVTGAATFLSTLNTTGLLTAVGGLFSQASSTFSSTLDVSGAASLLGGATITCTGCITDTNLTNTLTGKTYNGLTITTGTNTFTLTRGDASIVRVGAHALTLTTTATTDATFPAGTITLADLGTAQTFSGNKTFSGTLTASGAVNFSGATSLSVPAVFVGTHLKFENGAMHAASTTASSSITFQIIEEEKGAGVATSTERQYFFIGADYVFGEFRCWGNGGTSTVRLQLFSEPIAGSPTMLIDQATCGALPMTIVSTASTSNLNTGQWLRVMVQNAEPTGARPSSILGGILIRKR